MFTQVLASTAANDVAESPQTSVQEGVFVETPLARLLGLAASQQGAQMAISRPTNGRNGNLVLSSVSSRVCAKESDMCLFPTYEHHLSALCHSNAPGLRVFMIVVQV